MRFKEFLQEKLFNEELNAQHRVFNIAVTAGIAFMLMATLLALFLGGTIAIGHALAIAGALILILWVANHFKIVKICAFLSVIVVNCIMLPYLFFETGGIYGCINLWFVLGILYALMVCKGKSRPFAVILSLFSIACTYLLAWYSPERVNSNHTTFEMYKDMGISVIVITLAMIGFHAIQNHNNNEEWERLEKEFKEKAEFNRGREEFFATMSHELRTPINTIQGLNEINLRESNISAEIEENSLYIQSACRTLLALLGDVLDYSKIESGKMDIVNARYEILTMVNELYISLKPRATAKNLRFDLNLSPELPQSLFGDSVRIKQILTNFLTNAIKYTEEGGVTLHVDCESNGAMAKLVFTVTDTGIGIKRDELEKVFEEYRRVDRKKNVNVEGTGLGLAISRKLAKLMGGEITVDSIYRKGSAFTFEVEQRILDNTPIGEINNIGEVETSFRYVYHQRFEAPDARVLVVDDNEMNRLVVKKLLRETRIQIDLANSGKQCLEMTKARKYHLIFMDHIMPEMDGIETLQEIRTQTNGLCRKTPVVALTANASAGIEREYIARGFDDYLVKPISSVALEQMVQRLLPKAFVKAYDASDEPLETAAVNAALAEAEEKHRDDLRVTVESVCDLTAEEMRRRSIGWISCYIRTEEGRFCDGKEITHGAVLDYLGHGKKVQMEMPSVEEYEAFFADALEEAYQVIHICSSAQIDNGYENAMQAAKSFDNVYVLDSKQVSGGTALLALAASDMMRKGLNFANIVKELERLREKVSAAFVIGDSESFFYNQKGSKLVRSLCDMFDLTPVVRLRDGKIHVAAFYRGNERKVFRKFVRKQIKEQPKLRYERLVMVYTGCPSELRNVILEEVKKRAHFDEILVMPASAAGSGISGLGSCGLYLIQ